MIAGDPRTGERRTRVLLTGGNGLLGEALRRLAPELRPDLELVAPSRAECDLMDGGAVAVLFAGDGASGQGFDAVVHAAAVVGGIRANIAEPYRFLADNVRLNDNVIRAAVEAGVGQFVNLGSSCMYPRDHRQPLVETDMLAAPLEPTNEGYALSKIVAAKCCAALDGRDGRVFKTLVPCNLFGVNDHFEGDRSHLVAATIGKTARAVDAGVDVIEVWGTGEVRREFLFADDLAAFILRGIGAMAEWPTIMNVGAGDDHTVNEYYAAAALALGYTGGYEHDLSAPVGMTRKLMDSSRAREHGWHRRTTLDEGMARAVAAYRAARPAHVMHDAS